MIIFDKIVFVHCRIIQTCACNRTFVDLAGFPCQLSRVSRISNSMHRVLLGRTNNRHRSI